MKHLFTKHPSGVGETYVQHMLMAFSFSGCLLVVSVVCVVHGVFPFLFETKASSMVDDLYERMCKKRSSSK